jgi:hypothetical protein
MRRGRVAKTCPEYLRLNILQDLKDAAAQYAYMRVHANALRSAPEGSEQHRGHAGAIGVRAQYTVELVSEMREKLETFLKKAKTQCL